ncbi:hypothetical protein BKA62DRAFT_160344, partial [Auriculariales sp. MPI-PUGE-AT-0066]
TRIGPKQRSRGGGSSLGLSSSLHLPHISNCNISLSPGPHAPTPQLGVCCDCEPDECVLLQCACLPGAAWQLFISCPPHLPLPAVNSTTAYASHMQQPAHPQWAQSSYSYASTASTSAAAGPSIATPSTSAEVEDSSPVGSKRKATGRAKTAPGPRPPKKARLEAPTSTPEQESIALPQHAQLQPTQVIDLAIPHTPTATAAAVAAVAGLLHTNTAITASSLSDTPPPLPNLFPAVEPFAPILQPDVDNILDFRFRVFMLCTQFYQAADALLKGTAEHVLEEARGDTPDPRIVLDQARTVCNELFTLLGAPDVTGAAAVGSLGLDGSVGLEGLLDFMDPTAAVAFDGDVSSIVVKVEEAPPAVAGPSSRPTSTGMGTPMGMTGVTGTSLSVSSSPAFSHMVTPTPQTTTATTTPETPASTGTSPQTPRSSRPGYAAIGAVGAGLQPSPQFGVNQVGHGHGHGQVFGGGGGGGGHGMASMMQSPQLAHLKHEPPVGPMGMVHHLKQEPGVVART